MEQMLLDVILLHPEYHALLQHPETAAQQEFDIENGHTNPYLHMGMHVAIREQASIDRPNGIAALYSQLTNRLGESDAEHQMMECLGAMLWTSHRDDQPHDEQTYLECIRKLL